MLLPCPLPPPCLLPQPWLLSLPCRSAVTHVPPRLRLPCRRRAALDCCRVLLPAVSLGATGAGGGQGVHVSAPLLILVCVCFEWMCVFECVRAHVYLCVWAGVRVDGRVSVPGARAAHGARRTAHGAWRRARILTRPPPHPPTHCVTRTHTLARARCRRWRRRTRPSSSSVRRPGPRAARARGADGAYRAAQPARPADKPRAAWSDGTRGHGGPRRRRRRASVRTSWRSPLSHRRSPAAAREASGGLPGDGPPLMPALVLPGLCLD